MIEKWAEDFETTVNNPPKEGDIITTIVSDEKGVLNISLMEGQEPFIYGKTFVPCIVGKPVGWFLQTSSSLKEKGLKCILLPNARNEVIRKFGVRSPTVEVKSLRVVRQSESKKSLLCEVAEF